MRFPPVVALALTALLVASLLGGVVVVGADSSSPSPPTAASTSPSPSVSPSPDSVSTSTLTPSLPPTATPSSTDTAAALVQSQSRSPAPADPRQVIRIELTGDGNATWTIESRFRLESSSDVEEFEAYAEAVAAGERDVGYDLETFEAFADLARESTEREMELVDAGWNEPRLESPASESGAESDDGDVRIGVVSTTFTWTNFAVVDGNRIHVGDAFTTADGGTWFGSLDDGQRLVIDSPSNYGYQDAPRAPRNGSLVWDGPYEFEAGELEATYLEGSTGGSGGGSGGSGDDGTDGPSDGPDGPNEGSVLSTLATGLGAIVLLAVVGGGGYYLLRARRSSSSSAGAASAERATGPDSEADGRARVAENGGTDVDAASASDSDSDSASDDGVVSRYDEDELAAQDRRGDREPLEGGEDGDATEDDEEDDEIDVELLSDEERVLRLLRQNNGRMKQASIVKETDWSNAKVSQLLSKMDDDGDIDKLRIGRENLITLPEVDPTEVN